LLPDLVHLGHGRAVDGVGDHDQGDTGDGHAEGVCDEQAGYDETGVAG
jgi:hypothetical protein